jgi:hypothetical protein
MAKTCWLGERLPAQLSAEDAAFDELIKKTQREMVIEEVNVK